MARCHVKTIEENVLEKVHASPVVELMANESKDTSVTKEMIMYARVLCKGNVDLCFLKLIEIRDGRAEMTEKAIVTYLEQANITMSRTSSFGSDGAAVLLGSVSGVSTRLKHLNSEML